jgi:lipoate-protein ligase A
MELAEKVPGGKLVRLTTGKNGVTISGDFFIYPEEGVNVLEETLSGLSGSESQDEIEHALYKAVRYNGLELIGIDIYVIARLYKGILDVESNRS